ncbi:MAG: S41 family peptidase [Chloroflexota bacterium]|nr:S41 family peptidase [Chloroflexota bacterium]
MGTVWEAWQLLNQYYVNKDAMEPKKMSQGAIEGLIKALDDPYTSYLDPKQYEMELQSFRSAYEGIGAHVALQQEKVVVVAPIAGSPAAKGGVLAGDRIMAIDGLSTEGMSLSEAVLKIRGPRGSVVKLLILHRGQEKPTEVVLTREEIRVPLVSLKTLPDRIAYVTLSQFGENAGRELKSELEKEVPQDAAGVILDLRNNPGGLLSEAVNVASLFMDQGGVVVYEAYRNGEQRPWNAGPKGRALPGRLAVLVNGGSASGSEVVAGALQDTGSAVIIGTKTFGKGSITTFRELSDGSALNITIARWLTPKGRLIEGQGLHPDIEVLLSDADREKGQDPQLERAVQYIKTGR